MFSSAYAADKSFDTVARDKYLSYGLRSNDIAQTFHSRTIQKQLFFVIDVPRDIFNSLFDDLEYAVAKANLHARKKYKITKGGAAPTNFFDAFDGDKTYARIYPLHVDHENNEYVYFINGYYQSVFRVYGNMILDIKFETQGPNTFFYINSYISINDPLLRDIAQFMMNFKKFKENMDRIIESTIREVQRTGFTTARALQRLREEQRKPVDPTGHD